MLQHPANRCNLRGRSVHKFSSGGYRGRNSRLQLEELEQRQLLSGNSTVDERFLFYSGSTRYDLPGGSNGRTPLAFSDDNAIATDKSAYLPGSGAATSANVSSYNQGINGIMVDLSPGGSHSSININDFSFKSGNSASVDGTWTTLSGAALPTVSVRLGMTGSANGAGTTSGSDRVELIWAPGTAVTQKWLEVTVLATANTGLAANDVFFFGSEIGYTGASNTAAIYTITDLGTLGGSMSYGYGINASAQVTGYANKTGNAANHAFLYDGTMHDLGTLGGSDSQGASINDSGQVAGTSTMPGDAVAHAFLYSGGVMTDLGTPSGYVTSWGDGINDSGQVSAKAYTTNNAVVHAFLYSNSAWTDLGTLGGTDSEGEGINASGQVTGSSNNATSA
ncbi:MAG TPA: hypothetical protein VGZ26_01220, partial [Pirellulales bacterium]|nr:hypothetical protein [Pirellulales bacterium]